MIAVPAWGKMKGRFSVGLLGDVARGRRGGVGVCLYILNAPTIFLRKIAMGKKSPKEEFGDMLNGLDEDTGLLRQYFIVYYAIFDNLRIDDGLERKINQNMRFWNLALNGIQAGLFLSLGRIFDTNGGHGIRRVFNLAIKHSEIFENIPAGYIAQLFSYAESYRDIYKLGCKGVREEILAHSQHTNHTSKARVFENISDEQVFNLVAFSKILSETLSDLFYKGETAAIPFDMPAFPTSLDHEGNESWTIPFLDKWGLGSETTGLLMSIK